MTVIVYYTLIGLLDREAWVNRHGKDRQYTKFALMSFVRLRLVLSRIMMKAQ